MAAFLRIETDNSLNLDLRVTAASELKRTEFTDLVVVGMGSAWLLLGVKPYLGLTEEDLTESTYARRYIGKYRKLYQEKHAHHDEHAPHAEASH